MVGKEGEGSGLQGRVFKTKRESTQKKEKTSCFGRGTKNKKGKRELDY